MPVAAQLSPFPLARKCPQRTRPKSPFNDESDHPLAPMRGPITTDMRREELQIVLSEPREVAAGSIARIPLMTFRMIGNIP
jgi:hypothetical protein